MSFQISRDSSLPLHIQLLDELRHLIKAGRLRAHDRLPGEWELVEQLGISRATIQKAWQSAEQEELIYRVAGKGTFVAETTRPASGRTTVGFFIPEYRGTFAVEMLSGAERVLREHGYAVHFANTDRDIDEENRLLRDVINNGGRGCILVPVRSDTQQRVLGSGELNVPVVLMDRPINGLILPCVSSNNYAGALQAMQHLIDLGHRRIHFVARPHMDLWPVAERYRAYQDALHRVGAEPAPPFLIGGETEMSSYEAYLHDNDEEIQPLMAFLQGEDAPTAIFAVNDWMAIKVQRAIQLIGLNNPQDISVIGFDDLDIAQYQNPPLTTIAQNANLMGAEAARRLITLMEGEESNEIITLLPTKLVLRSSTAPHAN